MGRNANSGPSRRVLRSDLANFRFFPNLPAELQLQIWELAAGDGPTIFVVHHQTGVPVLAKAGDPLPWSGAALLAVCRASRAIATRIWGPNVHSIPSPATCYPRIRRRGRRALPIDLATDALYWRGSWESCFDSYGGWASYGVKYATVAFRYQVVPGNKCGNCNSRRGPAASQSSAGAGNCYSCVEAIAMRPARVASIRRVMMVVELFSAALDGPGRTRPPGPVYTTRTGVQRFTEAGVMVYAATQMGQYDNVPKGAEFFDVTDGLVDVVTGRELFEVEDAMLGVLEEARGALKLAEKRWLEWKADNPNDVRGRKDRKVEFRILVGAIKPSVPGGFIDELGQPTSVPQWWSF